MVAWKVEEAYTFRKRLKGLMFTKQLPERSALHISPCPSIHTFFMNYAIDVLYLNDQNEIVGAEEHLRPGKIGQRVSGARSVIELPAGTINSLSLETGQSLAFVSEINQSSEIQNKTSIS
ncbi:DUF192 domain-containing protein [Salsuginibacillus kocurii]|uniref:DUF192 domain-containing protein n=1 Tax=Salsuginibacillus kocurii TaxID=427078 RepID=UPI0003A00BB0|nr:DUF192 domain-containing protein [Salsuginibacillus kocurii]